MKTLSKSNEESNKLTKQCLQTAIIKLMSEMSFNDISITELVSVAGVSRASFYRNYKTKDDILNEIVDNFLASLNDESLSIEYNKNPYAWYLKFFTAMKENGHDLKILAKAQLLNFELFYKKNFKFPNFHISTSYDLIAFSGAINAIVSKWIRDGMKESPSKMAEICYSLFCK